MVRHIKWANKAARLQKISPASGGMPARPEAQATRVDGDLYKCKRTLQLSAPFRQPSITEIGVYTATIILFWP